jgi:hypothetical protein
VTRAPTYEEIREPSLRRVSALLCAVVTGVGAIGAGAIVINLPSVARAQSAAPADSMTVAARRLTQTQYRNIIGEVFGAGVQLNGRFELEQREAGLMAIGSAPLSITASGFEQYFSLGSSIANQVLDEQRREATVGCAPADPTAADDACARQFIAAYGEKLFRRPLTESEIESRVATARLAADQAGDFYEGAKYALTSLLVAPDFLFRIETAELDPANPGALRLDAFTKASRLSFLFTGSSPDAELMAAAKSGAIHTRAGLQAQLERLAASDKLEQGARAFFSDLLQFDHFENLNKDAAAYPKFSQAVAEAAREQTLKTLIDQLITKGRDYRDIFTSNETFINRELAAVYQTPYATKEAWMAYTFPEASERSGILTQVTFLSLFSHPAASSPTKRGVKLQEIFNCFIMPEPPADVDFSLVQALETGTVRTRLIAHMENEGCAGCHMMVDPAGLALERFDGLGQYRRMENGEVIDVSSQLATGREVVGARGLGQAMHDDPQVPGCITQQVYAYGVGAAPNAEMTDYLDAQTTAFAADGYRFVELMKNIASSPEFFAVETPEGARPVVPAAVAMRQTGSQGGNQ